MANGCGCAPVRRVSQLRPQLDTRRAATVHCRQRRGVQEIVVGQGIEDSAELGQHGNPTVGDGLRQGCLGVQDASFTDEALPDDEADSRTVAEPLAL
jgi:hypothetical protein